MKRRQGNADDSRRNRHGDVVQDILANMESTLDQRNKRRTNKIVRTLGETQTSERRTRLPPVPKFQRKRRVSILSLIAAREKAQVLKSMTDSDSGGQSNNVSLSLSQQLTVIAEDEPLPHIDNKPKTAPDTSIGRHRNAETIERIRKKGSITGKRRGFTSRGTLTIHPDYLQELIARHKDHLNAEVLGTVKRQQNQNFACFIDRVIEDENERIGIEEAFATTRRNASKGRAYAIWREQIMKDLVLCQPNALSAVFYEQILDDPSQHIQYRGMATEETKRDIKRNATPQRGVIGDARGLRGWSMIEEGVRAKAPIPERQPQAMRRASLMEAFALPVSAPRRSSVTSVSHMEGV